MEQELAKKKRKGEEVKAAAGKKKVKTDQVPKKTKEKKGALKEVDIRPPQPAAKSHEEQAAQ